MPMPVTLTPKHAAIRAFYENRDRINAQRVTNEMGVREPFKMLLDATARLAGWTLLTEQTQVGQGRNIRPDGVLHWVFSGNL